MTITKVTQSYYSGQNYIWDIAIFNNEIYGSTYSSARLFKWNGTDAWTLAAGTYDSNSDVYSLLVFNNKLYGGTNPNGQLLEYDESGGQWIEKAPGFSGQVAIMILCEFEGELYAGTGNGANLLKWNGTDAWTLAAAVIPSTEYRLQSLVVYNNKLYGATVVNSSTGSSGGKLYEYNKSAGTMDLVADQAYSQTQIRRLVVHDNKLFASTYPGGLLFEWNGTDAWIKRADQLDGQSYIGGLVSGDRLYGSTFPSAEIFAWNGTDAWTPVAAGLPLDEGIWDLIVYNKKVYGGTSPGATLVEYEDVFLIADFSADVTSGTAPLTVNFTDGSTGSPTSWLWDFGDGGTSTSQNPSYEYTTAGTYTVTLSISKSGSSDTLVKTDYITVAEDPFYADFSADVTSGTTPLSVSFIDESVGTPTTWLWDFGDGGTSTSQNPSYTYITSGTYTVTLSIDKSGDSDTLIKTDYITVVDDIFNADFSVNPRVGIAPLTVSFIDDSTSISSTISSRIWTFGDGGIFTGNSTLVSYTYTSPGIYTVSLVISDGASKQDTETKSNYIAVNEVVITPNMIIAKSESNSEVRYWNFYLDQEGHLIFENEEVTYTSVNKIIDINKWTFVQFNPGSNKMYVGDSTSYIREINMIIKSTSSPEIPQKKGLYSALNSSIRVDELKIWYGEQNLTDYFKGLWSMSSQVI